MKFYDEHKSNKFEIIAFHDGTVKSFEELDEKAAPAREKHWGGRHLPFPVLLDASGETIKRFEIQAFPTMILFDPDGRLVGRARLETLQQALKGEVETPEPRAPRDAGE